MHALPGGPKPDVRLQLADLGFPGIPQGFQDAGASMLTVHFVDPTHLLLTYSSRGLVERIPNDPPDDDDRAVVALLLELPSGKVLARTRWHLHDHGQYLWSVGSGRFLLRVRSTLTAIAPMANLASGDAFRQMPFVHTSGRLSAVVVSPEHDLVTVESISEEEIYKLQQRNVVGDVAPPDRVPVQLFSFVRITGIGSPQSPITSIPSGAVKVKGVGALPLNGRGYLFAEGEKRNRWKMQFEGFDGQSRTLSEVDSSCPPQMQFVSPSQFVVFSCRGSSDNLLLSAFDFAPHEMWEEPMSGAVPFDQFAYAQQSGRFALSRTTFASNPSAMLGFGGIGPVQGSSATQEVRVYQVESGDLLLKLACSPVTRAGQNFDLSADGLSVLVLRDGVLEVYRLPPLSAQDKKDLAEIQKLEPPASSSPVQLRRFLRDAAEAAAGAQQADGTAALPEAASTPAAAAGSSPRVPANAPSGDSEIDLPRKPPTLLNPGEKPEKP